MSPNNNPHLKCLRSLFIHTSPSTLPPSHSSTINDIGNIGSSGGGGGPSRASLIDTSQRRFRASAGSGSGAFMSATSTLTRAFRKSSASLTRRSATEKVPSALSLEQTQPAPHIRGRLDAAVPSSSSGSGGKLKRPVISGPTMISNPVLSKSVCII